MSSRIPPSLSSKPPGLNQQWRWENEIKKTNTISQQIYKSTSNKVHKSDNKSGWKYIYKNIMNYIEETQAIRWVCISIETSSIKYPIVGSLYILQHTIVCQSRKIVVYSSSATLQCYSASVATYWQCFVL